MPISLPTLDTLDALTVATPCTVPWDEMSGSDRSRFCDQCRRQVFDLSALTTAEATELLSDPTGAPCVRLYRRPDGRVLTADCPVGLRTRVWRWLRRRAAWAASLFAVLFVPACRTATQGALGGAYGNVPLPASLQDDAPGTKGRPPAAHTESGGPGVASVPGT